MTIEQRKKQLTIRGGIVGIVLVASIAVGMVACGSNTNHVGQNNPETTQQSESSEIGSVADSQATENVSTESETVTEEADLDEAVLSVVEVEVGTKMLQNENYFSEYDGQEFVVENPPTEEQLSVVGETYDVNVTCDEVKGVVQVKVVDTTAPVIEGTKDRTVYLGASVSYRKNVTVTDNSGEEIELKIDAADVDTSVKGSYTVTYTATDSSNNTTTETITLKVVDKPVIDEDYVRPMVEEIVNEVIDDDMSQWDKAYALYNWCRKNIRYGSAGDRTSIWTGAYEGVYKRKGDCYAYYATYAAMLDIAGIPNMKVARIGGTSNHWWNLVNVGDGWYHCDSSPRRLGDPYICFMQTDAQVAAYTLTYPEKPNYYTFDPELYPERGTEIVFGE